MLFCESESDDILWSALSYGVVGELKCISYTTPDNGWLLCDGSAVSRTTYASLFAKIGTTYGAGNNSTTFNLPNLTGKFPLGMSPSLSLGATGGEAEHTLTVDEIPSHNHSMAMYNTQTAGTLAASANATRPQGQGVTSYTGGGDPHNNMPPYLVINWEIKY